MEELGRGAYGIVYKAINTSAGNFVAIKKLLPNKAAAQKERIIASIMSEVGLLKNLSHSNIVRYVDHITGETDFIVMEYVDNGSLHGMVKKHGILPEGL